MLGKIAQFLQIAKLIADLLDKGSKCKGFESIALYLTLTTIIGILAVEMAMMASMPIGAFFVGFALDWAFDWLLGQSPQCK